MIRYGDANCNSCHVSPTGGGVLNAYGRNSSGQLLSTWSKDNEGAFVYGALDKTLPDSLYLGGDVRGIGTYKNSRIYKEGRIFLMQADLEAAFELWRFTLVAEAGLFDGQFASLRHYLMYRPTDWLNIRAGKFRQAFGINTPEHTLATKRALGWDENTETYNVEASVLTNKGAIYLTGVLGDFESTYTSRGVSFGTEGLAEKGVSARASAFIADHYEVGASYHYGSNATTDRHLAGPFVILGFSQSLFYQAELDFQSSTPTVGGSAARGLFNYQRLTYQPVQGLQLFVTQEMARPSIHDDLNAFLRYGAGAQFFPRPHFEIDLRWNIATRGYRAGGPFDHLAWVIAHFYL